jgi:mannose-1-phosphate guanylyltransferase/phosphomannomutase
MKAVVMAGGEGSRLRPLTINRPKPMVPMVNKAMMAHILDLLKRHGITDVVVTVQYLAANIQDDFGDGESLGMKIVYSVEETPLGTGGSVKHAQQYLDDTFLVISGDALTDFDLTRIVEYHRQKKAMATLALYRVPNPLEYGVIIIDGDGHIRQFLEKPSWGEVFSDTINTGIYVLEPAALDYFEPNKVFDFSKDLFPLILERGDPIYGYVAEGYWCDVGSLQEYMRATSDLLAGKVHLGELGQHIGGSIWTGKDVDIAPDAQLYGPIYLGDGVKIKGGVVIRGPSVIRDYTIVDTRAHVDRSIIWRNSYIGERAEVRGAILGRQVTFKANAVAFEGSVVGDETIVEQGAIIHPNVKIWPNKEIEAGATVRSSIIWGAQGRRVLFGRYGVTGLVNVDLTPEFAAKLGAAFGASLPMGAVVTINRDPHRTPRMIKRALISGLPSAGVNVLDLRTVPIPVARYYTRTFPDAKGGIHVRLSPFDNRVVDVKLFDDKGMDINKATQRKVESVFFREDFRRAYLDEIGTIEYATLVEERYIEGFMAGIDGDAIRAKKPYLVVDYAYATASLFLPTILSRLGCNVVALNASPDETRMSIPAAEFERAVNQLALISSSIQADMGVRLDVGGEKIFVADDKGNVLPGTIILAALSTLALAANPGGTIAVPIHQPRIFEQIAAQYGGQVIRTKIDTAELVLAATQPGVVLVGDGDGSVAFAAFQPALDGMFAIAKTLELLAKQKMKLSDVVRGLPRYFTAHHKVTCPWEKKGQIMRVLNEQYRVSEGHVIDGIQIDLSGNEWVLILPDPDQPIFHLYAESTSADQAQGLVDKYARIVEGLQT